MAGHREARTFLIGAGQTVQTREANHPAHGRIRRVSRFTPPRLWNVGLLPPSGAIHASCLAALLALSVVCVSAQTGARRLTTIDALKQFPGYFHLQNVLLRGEFVERGPQLVLRSDAADINLLNPAQAKSGPVEVRGQLIDVGRLEPGDSRLGTYSERRGNEAWPRPGAELLLNITSVVDAQLATAATVRALALEPWKFEGRSITLVGNFRGRNLFGDLPEAPGKSRYDFVLSGAEGAVWVTGVRPRGRGFDLDVERRMDANRWLQITGVVTHDRGLVLVAATDVALATEPPSTALIAEPTVEAAPPPPVDIVFSSPTPDEIDVPTTALVRVQFSRGLRESSLAGQVRVTYVDSTSTDAQPDFKMSYDAATRALQIAFARPLESNRTVKVELLPGIVAFDGGPSSSWTLTFSVGAR